MMTGPMMGSSSALSLQQQQPAGSVSGRGSRADRTFTKITAHQNSDMNALAVHDYAPIIASGSHKQFIKVFKTNGRSLSMIRYHDSFLGQRIGPISCLAFHKSVRPVFSV